MQMRVFVLLLFLILHFCAFLDFSSILYFFALHFFRSPFYSTIPPPLQFPLERMVICYWCIFGVPCHSFLSVVDVHIPCVKA